MAQVIQFPGTQKPRPTDTRKAALEGAAYQIKSALAPLQSQDRRALLLALARRLYQCNIRLLNSTRPCSAIALAMASASSLSTAINCGSTVSKHQRNAASNIA